MSVDIWASKAGVDPTRIKFFEADLSLSDLNKAIESGERNVKGEALSADWFPKEAYGRYAEKFLPKQEDLIYFGSFFVVSARLAKILQDLDLGGGALYPIKLFQHDRKTPVDGSYYCLNFGNAKLWFLPENSPRTRCLNTTNGPHWKPPMELNDDDITVSAEAAAGADLWIDPRLKNVFFVSARLATALRQADLEKFFRFKKCNILTGTVELS